MGRRKKQMHIEDAINDAAPKAGHNSKVELTEDERHALHLRHCREYEVALAAKKKSDADIKNVGKRIKAEDDTVVRVKKTIKARTPEGEAELKAEMEETANVLRWSGVSVGETIDMFPTDRTPSVDRAKAAGKLAGLAGEVAKPPHAPSVPQYAAWMEGWQDGQEILASAFAKAPTMPPESEHVGNGADLSDVPFAAPPTEMPTNPAMPG